MKQRIPLKVTLSLIADVAESLDVIFNRHRLDAPLANLTRQFEAQQHHGVSERQSVIVGFWHDASRWRSRVETREMQYDAMEYMAPEHLFFEPGVRHLTYIHW